MPWQSTFVLGSHSKGCHLITNEINKHIAEGLKQTPIGILHIFIKHTSAALTLNENYDPDVRTDMDMAMDKIVGEDLPWLHTDEGPDDSASHTKASLMGTSVQIPISNSKLNLGTWQGIYLTEFRHIAHSRTIVATIIP